MTLDREKPFGEVFGGSGDVRFEQAGRTFDAAGNLLEKAPAVPRAKKPAKPVAPEETDVSLSLDTADQLAAQLLA